jgi:hypothetical protein
VSGASPSLFGSSVSGEWIRAGNREFTVVNISFNYDPARRGRREHHEGHGLVNVQS